jgi:hypothetical protein
MEMSRKNSNKKTKVTPKETPNILILPRDKPKAIIAESTTTACITECERNISLSHSIKEEELKTL